MTDPSGTPGPADGQQRRHRQPDRARRPVRRRGQAAGDVGADVPRSVDHGRAPPGFTYTSWWPLLVAAAVTGLVGMIVRPVLVEVAAAIGWIAVALATLFGQAIVMQLAMDIVPGASFDSFWTAVAAAWIAAAFGTLLVWLFSAGTDESFAASLLRIKPGEIPDPEVDGVVFVQLDGVSFPVMQWVLQSGTMPTLRRWLDDGSHAVHEWTVQLPCTTPASQQAILQGSVGRRPGLPLVRPRAGPRAGGQPSRGRLDHRDAGQHRPRPARRRRGLDLQPVHRRRAEGRHDDEQAGGVARVAPDPPGVRALPAPARRPGAQPLPDGRRDRPGAVPGGATAAAATCIRGSTAPGPSPGCAPSATACCATSTPPS